MKRTKSAREAKRQEERHRGLLRGGDHHHHHRELGDGVSATYCPNDALVNESYELASVWGFKEVEIGISTAYMYAPAMSLDAKIMC